MSDLPIEVGAEAKDVILTEALPEYERGRIFIYHYLKRLNINTYLLERVLSYPSVLFFDDGINRITTPYFFSAFIDNTIEASILIITKLIIDGKDDLFTLRRFQNRVLKSMKSEYVAAFKQRKKENEQNLQQVTSNLNKLDALRDKHIAHFTQEYFHEAFDASVIKEDRQLLLEEIKAVCEKLNACFHNFSFTRGKYSLLPFEYRPDIFRGVGTDIEEVLDTLARSSSVLSLPERDPVLWREIINSRREESSQFNHYRKKFDMEEVSLD